MKILHITASYKPAYIYGGPIYSVSALCEALVESKELKDGGFDSAQPDIGFVSAQPDIGFNSAQPDIGFNSAQPNISFNSAQPDTKDLKQDSFSLSAFQASLPEGEKKIMVEVYTTLANGKEELPYQSGELKVVNGVPVRYFKRITKDHSHFSPSLLLHLWKNAKQYDVIHIHSWWNLVSMGSVLICLLKGIKPIVSPRGMLGDYTFTRSKNLFHQILGKFLLSRCDFHATTLMEAEEIVKRVGSLKSEVRSLTSEVKNTGVEIIDLMEEADFRGERPESEVKSEKWKVKSLKSGVREEQEENGWKEEVRSPRSGTREEQRQGNRIYVVHNIVQLPDPIPMRTRVFDGTLKLIFLSRIHPKKGIELLLEALAEVDFPFSLTIVGEGEDSYVESLKFKVESLKLSDKVHWNGAVYGDEKFQLLAAHDLLVLPSFNENFANVVIESVAVGTPVLISEHVGLHHYISQNHLGLVHQLNKASLLSQLLKFKKSSPTGLSFRKDFSSLPLLAKYFSLYHA